MQQIRGEWFNAYSSLLAFTNADPDKKVEVFAFQHKLVRLFSLLYASALEQVTTIDDAVLEIVELEGFELESLSALKSAHDKCEVVLQWIQKQIVQSAGADVVKVAPPILSRVYNQLGNGIVNLNNAKKITDFPIPFPLAQMVVFMLVCHWMMTVITCIVYVKSMWTATAICYLTVFSFWTINFISMELEMPFGDDANDLPLHDMQRDFNKSLVDLLKPSLAHLPAYEVGDHAKAELLTTTEIDTNRYFDVLLTRGAAVAKGIAADEIVLFQIVVEPPTFSGVIPLAEPATATELNGGSLWEPRVHSAGPACPRRPGRPPDSAIPDRSKQAVGGGQPSPDPPQIKHQREEPFIGGQPSRLVGDMELRVGDGSPDAFHQPRG